MKKIIYLFLIVLLTNTGNLTAQPNIVVSPDSLYASLPATEFEIDLLAQISNFTGGTILIRWTRVIEQKPQEWTVNFCDKNLCYLEVVSTRTFDMNNGESGMLKPIFYPNEVPGTGVLRLYLQSETPGVTWADTIVYVAVATGVSGTVNIEQVTNVSVFPNPANDMLNVVTADTNLRGQWRIMDAAGKVWNRSDSANSPIAGQIPVANLPVGFYLLDVLNSDGRHIGAKRFGVQR
ncbi:MAG: T9SS type A sorting domain-containing protein [Saprospiraceae bacterium]|jgi:hypothetical protein|nr:T9SS type A sorting domain-containing protein [Saprospiraceae bacterium]